MPRFPFRRSVGEDLRDLFGHDRLKDQERGLGYSSISPGEGSLDILDASGNVVAQFGHAAGKSGFLVPNGAGWQTVQEAAAAAVAAGTAGLNSRMSTAEGRLDSHAGRIGATEGDISTLQSTKVSQTTHNALAGRVGAAEGRLDSHAGRIGATEGDIGHAIGRLDAHAARIGATESTNSAQSSRMGRNENEIDKIISYANSLNARVSELEEGPIKPGLPPNPKG